MEIQDIIVVLIVAVAVGYVAHRIYLRLTGHHHSCHCGSDCHCDADCSKCKMK